MGHQWKKISDKISKCEICGQYKSETSMFMVFPCKERKSLRENKRHLGDAVYAAQREDGMLVLTTEDGVNVTNEIVIEYPVLMQLFEYLSLDVRRRDV